MDRPSFDELAQYTNRTRLRSTTRKRLLTRRSLLRGALGASALGAVGALSACGVQGHVVPQNGQATGQAAVDRSAAEKKVVFANWPAYIDVDDKNPNIRPSLDAFEKRSGIQVSYLEVINDNNDWYTKVDPSLVKGVDTGYDIMVVSDYMVAKYRTYDYIQKLDLANIPNHSRLLPEVLHDPTDPGRRFTIPWAYGYTTVAYNNHLVKQPISAYAELFTRPDLHGRVSLFAEMEDTMGVAMLAVGTDPENFTDAEFNKALDYVRRAKESGQIRAFTGNDYLSDFQQGNTAVTMAYSGDVAQLGKPNLVTVNLPKEGLIAWSDNCVIPNFARHKTNAEKLLNYYLDPQVAAELDDYIDYIPVVQGAEQALQQLDAQAAASPLIVPTAQMKARSRGFKNLSIAQLNDYTSRFQQVTGQ